MVDVVEPSSWQLLEFIADRVRGIRTASGYYSELGAGPVILDDANGDLEAGQPVTVIFASDIDPTGAGSGFVSSDVDVTIQFSLPRGFGETNPNKLVHRARADLVRALTVKDRDLPRFIRTFVLTGSQLAAVADDDGSASVVAQVTARAGLTELGSSDTTQPQR